MLESFLTRFAIIFSVSTLRYVLFAGVAYLLFYVWKRRDWIGMKIQQKFPERAHIKREVFYSLLTFIVFGLIGGGIYLLKTAGYTKIYSDFAEHSVWYFIFSVVVFIIAHDTYFYWTHRLMHHKKIYKHVHLIHHQSTNPTPWTSFAFHPLEAIVEIGILPILIFIMPVHPLAIVTWILYMTFMNVLGHLGFEFYPSGFTKGALTKWHNTSTHHNMHHRLVNCNYGLYFNIWDMMMRTNHEKYHENFEAVRENFNSSKVEENSGAGADLQTA